MRWRPVALVSLAAAGAQALAQEGFTPGHVFLYEFAFEGCRTRTTWIREFDPATGKSWIFADYFDGLCGNNGMRFTPDGTRLRVLNANSNNVMDFDGGGHGTVVYTGADGLRAPWGQNGLAWDAYGNFYVGNELSWRILKFPADRRPGVIFANEAPGGMAFSRDGDLFRARGDVRRIAQDGTVTVFDSFGVYELARTLTFDLPGNLFVGTSDGPQAYLYRYEGTRVDTRRLLASGWMDGHGGYVTIAMSPDDTHVYFLDFFRLWSIDAQTGDMTLLLKLPEEHTTGRGMAVYVPPRRGDVNCDGWVNNFDIDPFVLAVTDPDAYAQQYTWCDIDLADINHDGVVDNFDIDLFVALLTE